MLKVAKFGGSSVAGAEQFRKVRAIVEADESRRVIVISAAGKRFGDDHKLTDLLYLIHAHLTYGVSAEEILRTVESRLTEIRDELEIPVDIASELAAFRKKLSKDTSVDEIVSRGEYFTSKLMAAYLGYAFVDAADCVFFALDGTLDRETTDAAIQGALERHGRIVIPGFYGQLPTGRLRVMSRGGSDITGAIAAAALNADVYENWTDVSGILMADPRIVPNPAPIATITFAELRELAYMGASVLHEESVQPVKERGIPLNIRNTNRPSDPGTMIVESDDAPDSGDRFITGIAGRKNFTIMTVYKHGMTLSQSLRQALEVFDRYRVQVEHITLGLDSFALVSSTAALGDGVYDIIAEIRRVCRPDDVELREGIAMVSAVGRKMSSRPGVSGRLFRALGDAGVNIRTIAQGADELAITVGVENDQYETAIRVLYESFGAE